MYNVKIYDDGLLKIFRTPKGPQVYLTNIRIHHWTGGAGLIGLGILGALLDKDKNRRNWYALSCLIGSILILDDLPDLISFIEETIIN